MLPLRWTERAVTNLADIADFQWLSPLELAVPIADRSQTKIDRVSLTPGANPPVKSRGFWADALRFRDTNGPSMARAPNGGLIYLQGAEDRPATYLRVVPNWVNQMKKAVDEANR